MSFEIDTHKQSCRAGFLSTSPIPECHIPVITPVLSSIGILLTSHGPKAQWLVTGGAGFIGSHLVQALLLLDQNVSVLDNLSTSDGSNLEAVRRAVSPAQWARLEFHDGDLRSPEAIRAALAGCAYVLHQAALASVPLSISEPESSHEVNVTGFMNLLNAARRSSVQRIVYASSSAVYGDCIDQPAREDRIGKPLSPYALSKRVNEEYAALFQDAYGLSSIGLRYFNVCGARQLPGGAYAAVIPKWAHALMHGQQPEVYGDGETTRDFCPVSTVVEANLRAALVPLPNDSPRVFNVGLGKSTSLNTLLSLMRRSVSSKYPEKILQPPIHRVARPGDIRHSCADVSLIRRWLGLAHDDHLADAIEECFDWIAASQ